MSLLNDMLLPFFVFFAVWSILWRCGLLARWYRPTDLTALASLPQLDRDLIAQECEKRASRDWRFMRPILINAFSFALGLTIASELGRMTSLNAFKSFMIIAVVATPGFYLAHYLHRTYKDCIFRTVLGDGITQKR